MNSEVRKYLSKLGRKGAKATNASLSAEDRIANAKKAAEARWRKPRKR